MLNVQTARDALTEDAFAAAGAAWRALTIEGTIALALVDGLAHAPLRA